ncbi:MAG: LAGLIDADG family homing endonuclease, partial [Halobacteriaceae archaeon]
MARAESQDLVETFQQFYRRYYTERIGDLARSYPREQRSLYIDWDDLYQFDPDLADDYLSRPGEHREYAEEALRLYDLPADVNLGQAHVRLRNIDESTDIREIRARHVNTMVAVTGMVRKATDVRPKVQEAAFECQRCGTLTRVPQSSEQFQEPHECEGCERQGPFKVNHDQSEFVDAQTLRVQESPEGLRGGETPQHIDVHVEDDLTGVAAPGDHVTVTGALRLDQQGSDNEKSPLFDIYMEGESVTIEDEEFEDMDITDEDKADIVELSNADDIYERMIDSMAPSIYGYREEKLAILLQLFSGVTKQLDDGSRVRGDLHILLIGDPGTGKCVDGDTAVTLVDGSEVPIRDLVESNLDYPKPVDDGVYDEVDFAVPSLQPDGTVGFQRATRVWKREAPETMYRVRTASGRELTVTPSHPLFVQSDGQPEARRAEKLKPGEWIARPRSLPTQSDDTLAVDYRRSRSNNAVRLDLPDEWTPWLARLVGYVIAEGYTTINEDNTGSVLVTNNDREVLDDVAEGLERLGLTYTERSGRESKEARSIACTASEFASFLAELEPAILEGSSDQRVPRPLMRASDRIKRAFLRAYVEAEGHVAVERRAISVSSMSRELLEGVRSLLTSTGIDSHLESRQNGSFRLRMSGRDAVKYVRRVGFVTGRKRRAAAALNDGTTTNTNTDVVPGLSDTLARVREALALSQFDVGIPRTTYQHYERGDRNPSHEALQSVVTSFEDRLDWLERARERVDGAEWGDVESLRDELGISQRMLADGMDVTQTAISYYEREDAVPDGGQTADAKQVVLDRIDEALAVAEDVRALGELARGDIVWDRIESIELVDSDDKWVYDLEIEGTHNYLTNGVISHNSQLLQYIRQVAPRSVYTSGKGSSSAGLTAAAVRDDFGDGQQWTLEAGALVLADKGIAAVDELDKMRPEDRSAMHEALEQQSVSISKAGINATLKSRCSLLGAANPKYGRFDQYEPLGEQIDLEPALISRFDLIFTVTDQPDAEEDARLADHILETNLAGERNTRAAELQTAAIEPEDDPVTPAIETELLRKYVAHAKSTVFPEMSEAARDRI